MELERTTDVLPGLPSRAPWLRSTIQSATNRIERLSADLVRAESTLAILDIPREGPLGQVVQGTGGLLIDWGWLRILGSGNVRMRGDLASWNGLGSQPTFPGIPGATLVAHDVLGGLFAINDGGLPGDLGGVHHLVPGRFEWVSLEVTYAGLLEWALTGDLEGFYGRNRWSGWQRDVLVLMGDQGIHRVAAERPTGRCRPISPRHVVPMTELFSLLQEPPRL